MLSLSYIYSIQMFNLIEKIYGRVIFGENFANYTLKISDILFRNVNF